MNVDRPCEARRSFSAAKSGSDMYTSPRTSTRPAYVDPQRDRRDRAQVVRDVLADLAVAARGAADQHAVLVDQRDREPVDLRLGDELERRILDPLARQVVAHPVHPRAQLRLGARVGERQHRLQVRDLVELGDRLAADALGRRVGRDELRVLALDRAQLVQQRVVGVVADLGVVEDVVAVPVVDELLAQLGGALGRRHCFPNSFARSYSRRPSMPCSAVRSKCSGVTAIRPAATAARSVPGSSSWVGESP